MAIALFLKDDAGELGMEVDQGREDKPERVLDFAAGAFTRVAITARGILGDDKAEADQLLYCSANGALIKTSGRDEPLARRPNDDLILDRFASVTGTEFFQHVARGTPQAQGLSSILLSENESIPAW
ncbi:hypothetical protein ACVIHI_008545 [Bradyrhizobium sp. USDA 4524]|nr:MULTISPECIES: hypothetical protein [unclassified Bradyrhizobium]MCP1845994.1 hypothetical protein [Bradyrhizobium sp. USDA 4538]MCP1907372.1 hypothetical protein [Bradyrhizobium sp. USDA 4537]MCP1985158.1 hypothetical protein [Bradyrhizobium sp. USDA 4539]